MKSPKLTDEELSRVLSEFCGPGLDHDYFAPREGWRENRCGCVAGAALGHISEDLRGSLRAWSVSDAVQPDSSPLMTGIITWPYPASTPDELLRYLESRGVA